MRCFGSGRGVERIVGSLYVVLCRTFGGVGAHHSRYLHIQVLKLRIFGNPAWFRQGKEMGFGNRNVCLRKACNIYDSRPNTVYRNEITYIHTVSMVLNLTCVGQSPHADSNFSAQHLAGTTHHAALIHQAHPTRNDKERLKGLQLKIIYTINSARHSLLIYEHPNPPNPV
jgi:hypothetical protein